MRFINDAVAAHICDDLARHMRLCCRSWRAADPGWDMLLDLFASGEGGVSVTSLCAASTRKPTSGLRALERLVDSGLVRRVNDNRDRRQILIIPTAKARTGMKSVYQRAVGLV